MVLFYWFVCPSYDSIGWDRYASLALNPALLSSNSALWLLTLLIKDKVGKSSTEFSYAINFSGA